MNIRKDTMIRISEAKGITIPNVNWRERIPRYAGKGGRKGVSRFKNI